MAEVRSGELLFVKSVKDGIPNRDPLNDSDARRLFDEEDGRISLSDVSIKRDVRDYVLARYPTAGMERSTCTSAKPAPRKATSWGDGLWRSRSWGSA